MSLHDLDEETDPFIHNIGFKITDGKIVEMMKNSDRRMVNPYFSYHTSASITGAESAFK